MMDENTPIVTYGPWNEDEYAMFERRCPKCGRLVKADETSGAHESVGGYLLHPAEKKEPPPNATSTAGTLQTSRCMKGRWTSRKSGI